MTGCILPCDVIAGNQQPKCVILREVAEFRHGEGIETSMTRTAISF